MSNDSPQPLPMKVQAHQQSLIRAPRANQAFAQVAGPFVVFSSLPYWLFSATGMRPNLPLKIDTSKDREHPLVALAVVARDMAEFNFSLHDYLMEFPAEEGERLIVLADGMAQRGGDAGTVAVLFTLRDVTSIVAERRKAAAIGAYHALVGRSLRMLEVYRRIAMYAPTESPVLITGETGTGKELVARAVHERSKRKEGPFVSVNCTALTPELFESELFGHEKGAFTGAIRQHKGRFERADGGTLFLDELGDMPLVTQAKLLRALEEGVIERVGSEEEHRVDVRVVAATNVALEAAVAAGRFRADLYHRIAVLRIHLAPLRERNGDIPLLVDHMIEVFNRRYNRDVKRFTPEAMRLLEDYTWPGNIRELRNVVERLFVETEGEAISAKALAGWITERDFLMPGDWNADALYQPRAPIIPRAEPASDISMPTSGYFPGGQQTTSSRPALPYSGDLPTKSAASYPFEQPLYIPDDQVVFEAGEESGRGKHVEKPKEITADLLKRAFHQNDGNITQAANSLGLHKATFYRHMKQLGLSREDLETPPEVVEAEEVEVEEVTPELIDPETETSR